MLGPVRAVLTSSDAVNVFMKLVHDVNLQVAEITTWAPLRTGATL
jgi:hypothetical protein